MNANSGLVIRKAPFRVLPKGHRLHGTFLKIIVGMDTVMVATIARGDDNPVWSTSRFFEMTPISGSPSIEIDTKTVTDSINDNIEPDELLIHHALTRKPTPKPVPPSLSAAIKREAPSLPLVFRLLLESTASQYVTFLETYMDWLKSNVSTDSNQWPDLLRFAKTMRNAVSHCGRISWHNPKTSPVEWRGIGYSHADDGKTAIGATFHMPELLLLMLDVSDELDRLGAPVIA